jgi:hypothetical protein
MIKDTTKNILYSALFSATIALVCAGCGGGGKSAAPITSDAGSYSLVEPVAREIGPAPATLVSGGATLVASLPATTTVTVTKRFYTYNRPEGVAGKIYDIKPDGMAFRSGTKLCISYSEATDYQPNELTIVTGEQLDQEVASTLDAANGRICAQLQHSSPYGLARARSITTPAYTFFGDMRTKELYRTKVTTTSETDSERGALAVTTILVDCNLNCIESGERTFKVVQGGKYDGDLYIGDNGAYQLWKDLGNLRWVQFKNSQGGLVAGIAYYLAVQYAKYYGGSPLPGYEAQLDPPDNRIQRFFYNSQGGLIPDFYIEIIREDSTSPGVIRAKVNRPNHPNFAYVINRSTAAITKSWVSTMDGAHSVSAAPGDAAYKAINDELLAAVYDLIGLDDTPDYTDGNAWDQYARYNPNQELFAVNVMNLLKGFGWNNVKQIEVYYRDRLKAMREPATRVNATPATDSPKSIFPD